MGKIKALIPADDVCALCQSGPVVRDGFCSECQQAIEQARAERQRGHTGPARDLLDQMSARLREKMDHCRKLAQAAGWELGQD